MNIFSKLSIGDSMISRRTASSLGAVYEAKFTYSHWRNGRNDFRLYKDLLYDFLYENEHSPWLCNIAKSLPSRSRQVKEMIMRLHTGETQYNATKNWSWEQRQLLGQQNLFDLAKDILNYWYEEADSHNKSKIEKKIKDLTRNLELDGYIYRNNTLLASESDVLDTEEEIGILKSLINDLNLNDREVIINHLSLSEDHYINGRWGDCISNIRNFLEGIMREVAVIHNQRVNGVNLSKKKYESPAKIRDYLENMGLLETKEKKAIASVYGLLSHTGGHPYMADNDQARLLRHLALTFSQFVMLRLQGLLNTLK